MSRVVPALILATGCAQSVVLEIDHHEVPCLCGEARTTCLSTRDAGAPDFGTICFGIEGYDHSWGVATTVEVIERPILAPAQDGSATARELVEVIAEAPVEPGTEFTLLFLGALDDMGYAELVSYDGAGGGQIIGGPAFSCEPATVCDDMEDLDDGERIDFEVTFAYGDPIDGPLLALAVAEPE